MSRTPVPDERFLRGPVASASACALHTYHWPKPPYSELHHVLPRAWQAAWRPEGMRGDGLWDTLTEPSCPTGHRKIHIFIPMLLRAAATEDPLDYKNAAFNTRRLTREQAVAYRSLCRWRELGGSLIFLRAQHLWGG